MLKASMRGFGNVNQAGLSACEYGHTICSSAREMFHIMAAPLKLLKIAYKDCVAGLI